MNLCRINITKYEDNGELNVICCVLLILRQDEHHPIQHTERVRPHNFFIFAGVLYLLLFRTDAI